MSSRSPPSGAYSRSPRLDLLYSVLAADARAVRSDDGLVPFKSAGFLVSTLAASLDRLVTRRALGRYLSALRARLALEPNGHEMVVQHNRWLGWRVVPRTTVARARLDSRTPPRRRPRAQRH